jgi:nitroimidazol reductase NimA-like FMN-containing flavoprotein (pyridoxamine 5'-phosphate oxidase superfamily)
MRRKDREITDIEEIIAIIQKCAVCRLALFDQEYPYIVPLNFGYLRKKDKLELYFHGANAGKKLSLINQNNKASFEMDCSHKLITAEKACDYTMEYESVMGTGTIEILGDGEKIQALTQLMKQYSNDSSFEFDENHVKAVAVFKLVVNTLTAKRLKRS